MTPPTDPCVCEAIQKHDNDLLFMDGHVHEHSDFEPFACVEPDCQCEGWRPPSAATEPETAENTAQTAPDARYRAAVTIPAGALDFSRQRTADAAQHLDDILTHHQTAGNPDEPLAVLGLADLLENSWPNSIDPMDVLALAIRRLQDATRPTARQLARDAIRRRTRKDTP